MVEGFFVYYTMEIWKEVRGYEDYEVSNLGRVKSLARTVTTARGSRTYRESILKGTLNSRGYLGVGLSKNGKSTTRTIHQLLAEVFLGHKPDGNKSVVDHKNNVKTDNRLENLQIISNRENTSKDRKGISKYIGVHWNKQAKKWQTQIFTNGKQKHLGLFTNEKEASQAYQTALKELLCTK